MRLLAPCAVLVLAVPPVEAQGLIGYQGRLLRDDGTAATGTASVGFAVFDAETGGTPLWSETQTLGLSEGYYSTFLGIVTPTGAIFDGGDRWLEVRIGGETLSPRQRFGSAPHALVAQSVSGGVAKVSRLEVDGQPVIDAGGRLAGNARYSGGAGIAIDDAAQTVSLVECQTGDVLEFDGTTWICTKAAIGSVTSVSAAAPLSVTDPYAAPNISISRAGASSSGYLSSSDWATFSAKYGATSQCSGDLSGSLAAPTVVGLQSRLVAATAPATGQVLKWTGSQWEPAPDRDAGGTVTNVLARAPLEVANGTSVPEISLARATADADGYLATADWTRFDAKYDAATQCGGDLSGPLASPTVTRLQSQPVSAASPGTSQVLKWTGAQWEPSDENSGGTVTRVTALGPLVVADETSTPQLSLPAAGQGVDGYLASADWALFHGKIDSSFQCGGDVSGPLTGLTVTRLQSQPVAATVPDTGQVLKWTGTQWEPSADADSGGTLTQVTATGPLSIGGSATAPDISMSAAAADSDGYLSSTDWTRFNTGLASLSSAGGDLSGTLSDATVAGLRGVEVRSTPPAPGDVLRYDGQAWGPAQVTVSGGGGTSSEYVDLVGDQIVAGTKTFVNRPVFLQTLEVAGGGTGVSTASAGTVFAAPPAGDGAPSFRSLARSDIPSLDASGISTGALAVARGGTGTGTAGANTFFGGPSGSGGAPIFRALAAADIPELDVSKLNAGALAVARGGTGTTSTGANTFFGGPASGSGAPAFRALAADDIPSLDVSRLTTGTLAVARGGTGTTSTSAGLVFAGPTSGTGAPGFRALAAGDLPALDASGIATGTLAVARGGTGASSTGPNLIFAGPSVGSGAPAFRALDRADIPLLDASSISSGVLPVARGGTGTSVALAQGSIVFAGASGILSSSPALFWNSSSGRLGIGTASPAATLDVLGTVGVSGAISAAGFTTSGSVGIGTTAPAAPLHVVGAIRAQQICNASGSNCRDLSSELDPPPDVVSLADARPSPSTGASALSTR